MWKLLKQISKDEEHGFALATNDFFRPDLKQIGNSIFEIRRYFVPEKGRTIKPLKLEITLANVKDCLLGLVENHAFVLGLAARNYEGVDNTNYQKTEPSFMFLSETLSVALDFTTSPRPSNAVCDVFIAFPTKPTMVLSLVDGDEDSEEALVYNTSVARGVRDKLIRFMDEDVNSIHGVINTSTLKDSVAFNTRLESLANDSFHFVPKISLLMNTRTYDRVLTALWADVAETKSLLRDNGDANDDCIRFLTKEQCIILVENINSKDVQVRCVPGSGATTLMLEVARRLSRGGDTLLVCRSREERDRLRSAYASVVSVNDLSKLDLSSFVNIVDETNSVAPETRRHHWQFASYLTDIKQLKYRKWIVQREPLGNIHTEKLQDTDVGEALGLQDTDVGVAESRMQEIESLNEELDSLKSNRDHKTRQLDKLQTDCWTHVEWQNAVDYLMRYPDVLSLFKVELPGVDSVSSFHREDQDEGNLPRRIKHRQRTIFAKDSKRKFPDPTSKLPGVKGEGQYTVKDGCHSHCRSTGLMHQLRRYQLGSLKDRDLTTLTLKVMAGDEQQLAYLTAKNDSLEKDFGSTVHIVGLECRPAPISCPKLHLDAARANTDWCHVTKDGELVNWPPDTRDEGQNRLQKYLGTCSSPIPLPPPPSTLTPLPTTPTYWETKTRVRVVEGVRLFILEIGMCEAGRVESEHCFSLQRRSWCVRVERCDRHGRSLCTRVWREGAPGECHQNTMSTTPGSQATLHYGVVLDVGRGRLAFIDLDREIVLGKYDEVFREPPVPLLTAGCSSPHYTAAMRLISGEDVDMTDTKRVLVYQALR
ncbi:uncharacterized protein [Haliotis cracherodii]|uniref:uncharacterized protein n=1 Tax=Haliotis cracherodii TaxID=6455 RepID=UPI0039E9D385